MTLNPISRWLAVAVALVSVTARADDAVKIVKAHESLRPVAGSADHGWFALPLQPGTPSTACTLYHIPGDATPGAARVARTLPVSPVAIATTQSSAILVFANEPERPRPVRQITAARLRAQWYVYSDPTPLPPLTGEGSLVGLVNTGEDPVALIRTDAPEHPLLLRLTRHDWQPLSAPIHLDPVNRWDLVALTDAIAIIERPKEASAATVWIGRPDADGAVAWERRTETIDPTAEVLGAENQLVTLTRSREGILLVDLIRGGSPMHIAAFKDVPSSAVAVPVADRITFAWEPPAPSLRLMTRAISLSGRVLHDGWAPLSNPVSSGEIQVLAAALGSLILTVMIFLLKPDRGAGLTTLPLGSSLAEPSRRLLATAIDLVPGLLLASAIWDNPEAPAQFADVGVLPLVVVASVTILHGFIGEAFFGRTLGKAVLGCRTVTLRGEHPRWAQALARNAAKVICPGLIVFLIANPFAPHPGAFGTIVILEPREDPDADSDDPKPPSA